MLLSIWDTAGSLRLSSPPELEQADSSHQRRTRPFPLSRQLVLPRVRRLSTPLLHYLPIISRLSPILVRRIPHSLSRRRGRAARLCLGRGGDEDGPTEGSGRERGADDVAGTSTSARGGCAGGGRLRHPFARNSHLGLPRSSPPDTNEEAFPRLLLRNDYAFLGNPILNLPHPFLLSPPLLLPLLLAPLLPLSSPLLFLQP